MLSLVCAHRELGHGDGRTDERTNGRTETTMKKATKIKTTASKRERKEGGGGRHDSRWKRASLFVYLCLNLNLSISRSHSRSLYGSISLVACLVLSILFFSSLPPSHSFSNPYYSTLFALEVFLVLNCDFTGTDVHVWASSVPLPFSLAQ